MTDNIPTPENATMLQAFEWYVPADGMHWQRLTKQIPQLASCGIRNLWLPPACKGSSKDGNGYDIYDLYDLGEFDQKGSVRTKWGTKDELIQLVKTAKDHQLGIYTDTVLNHKAGADRTERCNVVEVDPNDRTRAVSGVYEIDGWLGFDFAGRGDMYSSLKYHWYHFSGTDYNQQNGKSAIYEIQGEGKGWSTSVDREHGNADFLMFADVDYKHPEVQEDVKNWGVWITEELSLSGMRFDAVPHFSEDFLKDFITHMATSIPNSNWFFVGEFWQDNTPNMLAYLERLDHKFSLFDAPLVANFSQLSATENSDLRSVFDNTLVQAVPVNAVTLVMNHDTQPGQASQTKIEGFFKPLAYCIILLRIDGYPCVFYGDLYGMKGDQGAPPACGGKLSVLIAARKLYAYGVQDDYFDAPNAVGWIRHGTYDKPSGMAVVLSNAGPATKRMWVGHMHAGEVWTDVLGWESSEVMIDSGGWGNFTCPGVSCSVWVNKDATGRDGLGTFDDNIYKE